MNPESIGTTEEIKKFAEEAAIERQRQKEEESKQSERQKEEENKQTEIKAEENDSNEDASEVVERSLERQAKDKFLLLQDWLEDDEYTVGEVREMVWGGGGVSPVTMQWWGRQCILVDLFTSYCSPLDNILRYFVSYEYLAPKYCVGNVQY